ncbi:hypothetical protein LTR37_018111 [Vermiconidia calcicola]|uniref:Uncharacterized protein n=1 Tax=Vermiconidia calcicola TaxID=1690605 RepID=A0ACC3MHW5_9PEZI|nr:hypothetical protein LTR37_018111 [Vermiconidia calcicola]
MAKAHSHASSPASDFDFDATGNDDRIYTTLHFLNLYALGNILNILIMQHTSRAIRTIRPGFLRRPFSSRTSTRSPWTPGPSPPRLPKEEQEMFEKLQQQSTGAFSSPKELDPKVEARDAEAGEQLEMMGGQSRSSEANNMLEQLRARATIAAKGDGGELHPNVRRGAPPEFEGDRNPKTGEVGGPKNDPLRWGGDWSYNGRVTDF